MALKIAILGLGLEGKSLLDYFQKRGAHITLLDENPETALPPTKNVQMYCGKTVFKNLKQKNIHWDHVFRSPGIPARQLKGIKNLTSLTEYFFEHCPCPIIGVTGTKGKGTTSTLIYTLLKKAGYDVHLGGNIGHSPLNFLDELKPESLVVLELSSFQIQTLKKSPHVAVLLRITPEHMDYHKDLGEYHTAKSQLVRTQKPIDVVVANRDDPVARRLANTSKAEKHWVSTQKRVETGAQLDGDRLVLKHKGMSQPILSRKQVGLLGAHNLENVLPAMAVASLFDVSPQTMQTVLKTFKGLPHRLEPAGVRKKVAYYNDSFSTTPETSIAAIRAFDKPLILIAGGSEKHSRFTHWAKVCAAEPHLKTIILTGKMSAERMAQALQKAIAKHRSPLKIVRVETLKDAIIHAQKIAKPGSVVLLSPACASFEEFENYKERGEFFKKLT